MFYTNRLSRKIYRGPENISFDGLLIVTEALDEWGLNSIRTIDPAIGITIIYGGFAKNGWHSEEEYRAAKSLCSGTRSVRCPAKAYRGDCYLWLERGKPVYGLLGSFSLVESQSGSHLLEIPEDSLTDVYDNVMHILSFAPSATDASVKFDEKKNLSAEDQELDMLNYEISSLFTQLTTTNGEPSRSILLSQLSLHADALEAISANVTDGDSADALLSRIRECLVANGWVPCEVCGKLSDPATFKKKNDKLMCSSCRRKNRPAPIFRA